MCGRFVLTHPAEALAELFGAELDDGVDLGPRYNICPTQPVLALRSLDEQRILSLLRWGFIPHWYKAPNDGPLLINARSETIAEKPAFRAAVRERRCIIPATGFYEWTREGDRKLPWFIHPRSEEPLLFAGVWQKWGEGEAAMETAAIVTCAANEALSGIHHRMPVILRNEDVALWLGEDGKGAARLMVGADDDLLGFHRVSTRINGAKDNQATYLDSEFTA